MRFRTYAFAFIIGIAVALAPNCIDRSLNVHDADYPVDGYKILPTWSRIDTNALRPIALYRVPFSLGKDTFKNLIVRVSDPGLFDTTLLAKDLPDNQIVLYPLACGVCTLTIDGLHPNGRHTVATKILRIANPYRIEGDTLFGLGEHGAFLLLPRPCSDSIGLDLRLGWQQDSSSPSLLHPTDTFSPLFEVRGVRKVRAILFDRLYEHSFVVDTLPINVPGHRPRLDSLRVLTDTIFPGQLPRIRIFADDADSVSIKALVISERAGILNDTFDLTGPLMYSSILTGKKQMRDTGVVLFSIRISDPSGLVSKPLYGRFVVKANPPVVRFNPDTSVIFLLPDVVQTVRVTTKSFDSLTYVWNIDGVDTITTSPQLSRIFITGAKKTAQVSVYAIDRFGYRGSAAYLTIQEELSAFDLQFKSDPPEACHKNSACWTVKTTRSDRVREFKPLFYWELLRSGEREPFYRTVAVPEGDSISTLCLSSLSLPGVFLDSIDCTVRVVLRDSTDTNRTSPMRVDSVTVRPFRPIVTIQKVFPRNDSVATGEPVIIRFEAHDINPGGRVDSVFWQETSTSRYRSVPVNDDTISLQWNLPTRVTVKFWTRDNDGEYSDTALLTLTVVKNRPRITGLATNKPVVYALERCTVAVTMESGILRSPVVKVLWHCDDGVPPTAITTGPTLPMTFPTPGEKPITIVAIDARGDSSLPFLGSLTIASGKPAVIPREYPDSISTKVAARIRFALSSPKSLIDTVFWEDAAENVIRFITLPYRDSSFSCTWPTPGVKTVRLWATDRLGDRSDTQTVSIIVVQNRPIISGLRKPLTTVVTRLPFTLSMTAAPGFSRSTLKTWRWHIVDDAITRDTMTSDSLLTLSFATPGIKRFSLLVADSLGDTSTMYLDSLSVDPGRPIVTGIAIDTAASGVWVNDSIAFAISATDINGSMTCYRIVLQKQGSGDSLVATGSENSISLIVPVGNDGVYTVFAYARDDDSLWSVAYEHPASIVVRAGTPLFTAITAPPSTWIFDTVKLIVSAYDSNGVISSMLCKWADGTVDSISFDPPVQSVTDTFIHYYIDHGNRRIIVHARDDDGALSTDSVFINVEKGAPTVQALADTFVWYDNKGGLRGDTLHFKAHAKDSNGTIARFVWILRGPLDTTASGMDTVETDVDSLVVGYSDFSFWVRHQPSRTFVTDSTYTSGVYVVDDDGIASAPDTFCWYIDAPRAFTASAEAKDGLIGDHQIFELVGGSSLNDSIIIRLQNCPASDTNYLSIKVSMLIDSLTDFLNPATVFNDTIAMTSDTGFVPIQRCTSKGNQSVMAYDAVTRQWRLSYRPALEEFSPYKQSASPTTWLLFRVLISCRTRSGAVQNFVSQVPLKMNRTLQYVP